MTLLVVGEALVEFYRPARDVPLDRPGEMVGPFPSGAPAIFASVAARLGVPTELCSVVGDDPFGRLLVERLSKDGVDVCGVRVDPERTTATAFVAYSSNGERTFVFHVRDSAAGRLRLEDLGDRPERCEWLHVSGSAVALGASLGATAVEAVRRAKAAGARVSVDPNLRPEVGAPDVRVTIAAMIEQADVVFPSEGELRALGLDEDRLVSGGVSVLTTLGPKGARVRGLDVDVLVPAPEVREVDPTGAGDTFAAGFVAARLKGFDPASAVRLGCERAARSVETIGPMESTVEPMVLSS